MLKIASFIIALIALAACANTNDTPLPMVSPNAPIWPLQPDHLDYGALPT
jgi:hypothetical protein